MHIFYSPDISGKFHELQGDEAKHALKVLRLQENDNVLLTNGQGESYTAKIIETGNKICRLEITGKHTQAPKNYFLEIAIAPPKTASRLEFMLEKLTELAADRITLFYSENSERRKINPERLQKILIAGMKQSKNFFMPEPVYRKSFQEVIDTAFDGKQLIAHCRDGCKKNMSEILMPNQNIKILIGPEGDFSKTEIEQAKQKKIQEISLGKQRLRTETAALYAAMAVNFINQQ